MIPAVVLSLVLLTSTIALPLTTQEHPITGTSQIQTGVPQTAIPQQNEKTGVQSEFYTPTGQTTQTSQYEQSSHQQAQVEKTGYQTPSEGVQTNQEYTGYNQQNTAVPKVENVPVNVEEPQTVYSKNPVLLPVQPLSVVPFNPTGQVLRPIVVPAEAIADGRVIITPIGSIQQRNFQDVYVTPENQVSHQVSRPATYTAVQTQEVEPNQQTYYAQQVEKQTPVQSTSQGYTPVYPSQETFNQEQQVPVTDVVKQTAEPVQGLYQAQQNVQPEKQAPFQEKFNTQVQEASEKQVPNQQQTQVYTGVPIVVQNVEHPQQYQTQNVEQQQVYEPQQSVEKQVPSYTPVEKTEKQGQYQEGYTQSQQQVQSVEKQASDQPAEHVPVHQQQPQVYSVQPEQVENQAPYHQTVHQQNVENVPEQVQKSSEVEQTQQYVQPQQVANYAGEHVYSFGERLPQVQHTLSSVPQVNSVQPSVSSAQE